MRHTTGLLLGLLVLAAAAGADEPKEVKALKTWTGSVADLDLQKKAPTGKVITDRKTFEELYTAWGGKDKPPKVDFAKEFVVVGTTRGSVLMLDARLGKGGDLQLGFVGTKDLGPGFRYLLAALPRDGVESVNGKKLGKADETDTLVRTLELVMETHALDKQLKAVEAEIVEATKDPKGDRRLLRQIEVKGALEQVQAEAEIIKKVKTETIPPAVQKEVAIARLTVRARTAKQFKERLQEAAKKTPDEISLALDLIDAIHDERQLAAERDALKESKDGPEGKDFRVKRLKIQAESLRARLDAVRKRRDDEKDEHGRGLMAERIRDLEVQLERVTAEREALERR